MLEVSGVAGRRCGLVQKVKKMTTQSDGNELQVSTSLRHPLGFRICIVVQGRESGHSYISVGPLSFDGGECRDFYLTIMDT